MELSANDPNDYRRKIKTRKELQEILGQRPRDQSVIMCHGTFDLVHPGHVRHLMFAKTKADILIASVTGDAHIDKANYRPFVPEQLRAMNLAALEVVDYVITDTEATPIENLKFLQPDFFAKGYEYFDGGIDPRTSEEINVLKSYGGEMVFTPGDVIFSSSAFINQAPPNITTDKLAVLTESEGITFDELKNVFDSFSDIRVHVIGDTIVDSHIYCATIGSGTSKTPTVTVRYERQVDFVGGAAVVARHLRRAGAQVKFTTVLGNDPLNELVLKELEADGITCAPSIDSSRPTTQKNVFIADDYRLLKMDKVDNSPISERVLEQLKESISTTECDVVVFSDFRHGIFSGNTIPQLINAMPPNVLKVADSQVASRWGNILDFKGFDLITPNEREARFSLADQDSGIRPLSLELYKRAECKTLILKLGARGILTYRAPNPEVGSFFSVDSFAKNITDAVGAGDALLAYATLSLYATRSPVIASILGSMAAAVACEQEGNVPINTARVAEMLNTTGKRANYV
jgi:rfaE bifunctional protein kinase chain/domain